MKSVGIICEYNPFHNGHLYHLEETKKMFPDARIVLIMSGNFLQRGEASLLNKWDKTKIALKYGVDLVVELPFLYATQSADTFAYGAIYLLNELKCDYLVFGSESNDITMLSELVDIQLNNKKYDNLVKEYMDGGINYPTAMSKALADLTKIKVNTSNDILGLSYVKAIKILKSKIVPYTIKRTSDFNSKDLDSNVVSATAIREALNSNIDIKKYVPNYTYSMLNQHLYKTEYYFPYLKYKILTEDSLDKYQTVDEGLSVRIKKYIVKSESLDELINNIKTKRYTYNKISRMLIHILCNFTKEESELFKHPEYIRILGFSKEGQKYLNSAKKDLNIPLVTKYSDIKNKMLDIDFRATTVYSSILNEEDKVKLIESEYKNIPIKED